MIKSILFLVLVLLVFNSCQNNSTGKIKMINDTEIINVLPSAEPLEFSNYFSDYKVYFIKSENSVADISNIYKINNNLLIRCTTEEYSVLLIDTNTGDIINKEGKKGKGPSEYLSVRSLDKIHNKFGIMDYSNHNISQYYLSTFQQISSNKLQGGYDVFSYLDSNHIVLYKDVLQIDDGRDEFKITILDLVDNKINNEFIRIDPILCWERAKTKAGSLIHINDTLVFFDTFIDTVYNVFYSRLEPRYILNTGQFMIPKSIMDDPKIKLGEFLQICTESNYIFGISNYFESNNYIFFNFIYNSKLYFSFYNKDLKKFKASSVVNDDLFLKNAVPIFENFTGIEAVGGDEDHLYFVVEPFFIVEKINEIKNKMTTADWRVFEEENKQLFDIYYNTNIEDNPIVIEYTFK